jgi:hypothetical protein
VTRRIRREKGQILTLRPPKNNNNTVIMTIMATMTENGNGKLPDWKEIGHEIPNQTEKSSSQFIYYAQFWNNSGIGFSKYSGNSDNSRIVLLEFFNTKKKVFLLESGIIPLFQICIYQFPEYLKKPIPELFLKWPSR